MTDETIYWTDGRTGNPGWWENAIAGNCSHPEGHDADGGTCSDADEPGDGFTTEPMFPVIPAGRPWLDAQDAGLTLFEVYDTRTDSAGIVQQQIALISYDEAFALQVAAGRPVCRMQHMCGRWLH